MARKVKARRHVDETLLRRYWTNMAESGLFVSAYKLFQLLKRNGYNIGCRRVDDFVWAQFTQQLHKLVYCHRGHFRQPILLVD